MYNAGYLGLITRHSIMMRLLWILIPLAAIALAGFAEWLKFKRHTASIGASTEELAASTEALKQEIQDLRQEKQQLVQRLQNLEAIVTSEVWDTIGSDPNLAATSLSEMQPPEEESDEEKVARISRRLRG
jgi:hypothetical protein